MVKILLVTAHIAQKHFNLLPYLLIAKVRVQPEP